jgi:predicted phage-related endonuclease
MTKQRDYVRASSLGSYLGVGFNSPEDQLKIDLGLVEESFDEAAQDRMSLGREFEDAALNYFEKKFGITITNRNVETIPLYSSLLTVKLVGKVDGMTVLDGVPTVVENKISNSNSYKFTDNLGYIIQCQAYMMGTETNQALLCGIYQGKPIYKIIKRDEAMINDIKEITDFIHSVMLGLDTFDNYPTHLLTKYSKTRLLQPLNNVDSNDKAIMENLVVIRDQIKELEYQKKNLEEHIKNKFDIGIFVDDTYEVKVNEYTKAGGYDIDAILLDYPNIDINKYKKPDIVYRTINTKMNKKKTTE